MPLALSEFGITLDTTTPNNPVLQVPFNAVKAAINWDTPPTVESGLGAWITALLQAVADKNPATVATDSVVVTQPTKGFGFRSGDQILTFNYSVTIYSQDDNPAKPDGDELI